MSEYCLKHFDSYLYLLQVFADYQIPNISMCSNSKKNGSSVKKILWKGCNLQIFQWWLNISFEG